MKPKHITKRAVTFLLAVVLLTGCLISHAANNETAHEAGGIPDPLIGVSLSNVKLAVLMTCDTGLDFNPSHITNNNPVNIVEKMVICGAETVVGFSAKTKVSDCNKFAPDLTQKLVQNGLSIEDAIDSINYFLYIKNMANIAVIGGNTDNTIR